MNTADKNCRAFNSIKPFRSKSSHTSSKGFTLLEVLIAIAIFSVISMASFSIFETVLNSDTVTKERTDRINELQRGFLIIERDMLQIARRSVRLNGEAPKLAFYTQILKVTPQVNRLLLLFVMVGLIQGYSYLAAICSQ